MHFPGKIRLGWDMDGKASNVASVIFVGMNYGYNLCSDRLVEMHVFKAGGYVSKNSLITSPWQFCLRVA